jgi:signal transduction histidine kinase
LATISAAGMQGGGTVKSLRRIRSVRLGIPAALILLTAVATGISLWQTLAHRQTLLSLETSFRKAPSRGELTGALCRLLPLLQDDAHSDLAYEERQSAANEHHDAFEQSLKTVRDLVADQQQRWQRLIASSRRQRAMDAGSVALFTSLNETLRQMSDHSALRDIGSPESAGDKARLTRRERTITAFRDHVFKMIDLIGQSPDPAARLMEQQNEAAERLQTSFLLTAILLALGIGEAVLVHLLLRKSLWRPLEAIGTSLAAVAKRDYSSRPMVKGVRELMHIQDSIEDIRKRSGAAEVDKDKEVEDRCNQRVRSERLAGIGLLATGVAHEINNPLTAIVGAADGLYYRVSDIAAKMSPDDAEIVREYLKMIQAEAKRCRSITSKLLDFARGREGERALYDVTAVVNEVVELFRHVKPYQTRLIEVNRHDPVRAYCNGPEIKQVILNLVANALQATPENGRLDIRISSTPDTVEVMLKDTGSGMSPETLEHLFDPFFSTKGPGQGTGLGLSISHAIVDQHQGTLEAASAGPGQGSTFRLRLPANEGAARAAAAQIAA